MKFGKKYEAYMRGLEAELPAVGIKRLKKMLKTCRRSPRPSAADDATSSDRRCTGHCTGNCYLSLAFAVRES
jgi:E3 ubiquitin-protein ligase BAH